MTQMTQVKMATTTLKSVDRGEIIEFKNTLCTVVEKDNPLGFNKFSLINLDTGTYHHNVMRQEICHVQSFDLDFDVDIPEIQPNLPETEPTTSVSLTLPTIDLVMDRGFLSDSNEYGARKD